MALAPGTRLGPYEVLAPLGAGGMGEVWRARDARLAREVAVKLLPADVASDPSRLKRFEKEARAASALNHPNIVTIYDIGSSESRSFIAMEMVAGKTLRELLFAGAMPVKRLLQIAAQIAEGLAKAHEAGIVHRDLKPENVMVTRDGLVKILDFGLAKLTHSETESGEVTNLPTETGTDAGVVMGTVGYMSPEQASGQPIDFRSDQFSFGSILYELVTGKRAFQKKTGAQTLTAIIEQEPEPIAAINPQTPAPLRWIVLRCLAKDPEERYGTTGDLARELATVRDHLSEATVSGEAVAAPPSRARSRLRLATILLPVVAVGIWLLTSRSLKNGVSRVPRVQQVTFRRINIWTAAFAPDAQTIVYTAFQRGKPELFSTRVGSRESRSLGVSAMIFSVSSIGDMALGQWPNRPGTLAQASLAGGAPREILENVGWADWSPDGKSLAVDHVVEGKHRLEFPIGKPLYESSEWGGRLRVSPKGDLVAIRTDSRSLSIVSISGEKRELAKDSDEFGWGPKGDELWFPRYADGATRIYAVTLAGRERLLASLPGDFVLHDISRGGRILVEGGAERWDVLGRFPGSDKDRNLNWHDATVPCDLSADGTTFVFSEKEPGWHNADVYKRKTDGSEAVRLGKGWCLGLSPDEKWVLSVPQNPAPQMVLLPTGAGQPIALRNDGLNSFELHVFRATFLPDGKRIVFSLDRGKGPRLFIQDIPDGVPKPISPEGFRLHSVSPDGSLLLVRKGDHFVLYAIGSGDTRPLPGVTREDQPIRWSADGRSIYLLQTDRAAMKILSLDLATGQRRPFPEIPFPDADAADYLSRRVLMTPDGRSIVYNYSRWQADLFVIEGVN